MDHRAAREQIERFIGDVLNLGKLDLIDELLTSDYVHHAPQAELHGHSDMREWVATLRRSFPDLEIQTLLILCDGSYAATMWAMGGTYTADTQESGASERRGVLNGITISRFESGRIAESWEHSDMLGLMKQLGAIPEMYLG